MAYAVTHIIAGILGAELISKFVIKKEIPFRYYVLSGVAGLLPDIDELFYPVAKIAGNASFESIHRHYTHNLFIPLIFIIAALIAFRMKKENIGIAALIFALGSFTHLLLDVSLLGEIGPFFPFSEFIMGFNIAAMFDKSIIVLAGLDALLLLGWLYWKEREQGF